MDYPVLTPREIVMLRSAKPELSSSMVSGAIKKNSPTESVSLHVECVAQGEMDIQTNHIKQEDLVSVHGVEDITVEDKRMEYIPCQPEIRKCMEVCVNGVKKRVILPNNQPILNAPGFIFAGSDASNCMPNTENPPNIFGKNEAVLEPADVARLQTERHSSSYEFQEVVNDRPQVCHQNISPDLQHGTNMNAINVRNADGEEVCQVSLDQLTSIIAKLSTDMAEKVIRYYGLHSDLTTALAPQPPVQSATMSTLQNLPISSHPHRHGEHSTKNGSVQSIITQGGVFSSVDQPKRPACDSACKTKNPTINHGKSHNPVPRPSDFRKYSTNTIRRSARKSKPRDSSLVLRKCYVKLFRLEDRSDLSELPAVKKLKLCSQKSIDHDHSFHERPHNGSEKQRTLTKVVHTCSRKDERQSSKTSPLLYNQLQQSDASRPTKRKGSQRCQKRKSTFKCESAVLPNVDKEVPPKVAKNTTSSLSADWLDVPSPKIDSRGPFFGQSGSVVARSSTLNFATMNQAFMQSVTPGCSNPTEREVVPSQKLVLLHSTGSRPRKYPAMKSFIPSHTSLSFPDVSNKLPTRVGAVEIESGTLTNVSQPHGPKLTLVKGAPHGTQLPLAKGTQEKAAPTPLVKPVSPLLIESASNSKFTLKNSTSSKPGAAVCTSSRVSTTLCNLTSVSPTPLYGWRNDKETSKTNIVSGTAKSELAKISHRTENTGLVSPWNDVEKPELQGRLNNEQHTGSHNASDDDNQFSCSQISPHIGVSSSIRPTTIRKVVIPLGSRPRFIFLRPNIPEHNKPGTSKPSGPPVSKALINAKQSTVWKIPLDTLHQRVAQTKLEAKDSSDLFTSPVCSASANPICLNEKLAQAKASVAEVNTIDTLKMHPSKDHGTAGAITTTGDSSLGNNSPKSIVCTPVPTMLLSASTERRDTDMHTWEVKEDPKGNILIRKLANDQIQGNIGPESVPSNSTGFVLQREDLAPSTESLKSTQPPKVSVPTGTSRPAAPKIIHLLKPVFKGNSSAVAKTNPANDAKTQSGLGMPRKWNRNGITIVQHSGKPVQNLTVTAKQDGGNQMKTPSCPSSVLNNKDSILKKQVQLYPKPTTCFQPTFRCWPISTDNSKNSFPTTMKKTGVRLSKIVGNVKTSTAASASRLTETTPPDIEPCSVNKIHHLREKLLDLKKSEEEMGTLTTALETSKKILHLLK